MTGLIYTKTVAAGCEKWHEQNLKMNTGNTHPSSAFILTSELTQQGSTAPVWPNDAG